MKKTLLSLAALTAIAHAGGDITPMQPITNIIPEAKGSVFDKLSIGGYGKMDYTNYLDRDGSNDKLDIYRFIMYVGYQFTDNIKLVSELEWEHGGREKTGGYGIVEQAYLDFRVNDALNFKVGHVIVPVGMVNLYHEPTAFYSVARPGTEKHIIPSTWHENGLMAHGSFDGGLSYQAGIIAGLNATKKDGSAIGSIRSMRQNGQKSKAEDFGFVGRIDYKSAMFNVGGSYYTGDAGQGVAGVDVTTSVGEVHAGFNYAGFKVQGLYAINEIDGNQGTDTKGEGYYANVAYTFGEWTPFAQYEKFDKDDSQTEGVTTDIILGLNWNPTSNVVLKADYVISKTNEGAAGDKDDNRFELGMGYNF